MASERKPGRSGAVATEANLNGVEHVIILNIGSCEGYAVCALAMYSTLDLSS